MKRFKEALVQFAHSNPSLFPQNDTNYPALIDQQFSQFFSDFHTPNHPPYAAMINRAIRELKEKGGSSEDSISKYIEEEYVDLPWAHSTLLKHHLEKLCDLKEIVMTHKKCYLLVGTDSDPVSTTTPEKQLTNSETGKKISQSGKKQKNRQDLKSGKTSSGKGKKGKKQKSRLDLESAKISSKHHKSYTKKGKFKQIIDVCQKEDQVIQALGEVTGEQEKHDVCIDQEMGEGEVCANATEQNQTDKTLLIKHSDVTDSENQSVEESNDKEQIGTCGTKKRKDKKRMIMPKRSSKRSKKNEETQLLVLSKINLNLDKEIIDAASQEQMQMIDIKTSDTQIQEENKDVEMALELHAEKSGDINLEQIQTETQLQVLSEVNLTLDTEIIDAAPQEQKQMIDVNTSDTQIQEENNDVEMALELHSDKSGDNNLEQIQMETQPQVLSEVNLNLDKEIIDATSPEQKQMIDVKTSDTQIQEENKDVEMALELHAEKSGDINLEQIQMEQSPPIPEQKESPNSNHILQKNGKQIWTRSQRKSMSKKDALAGSELTGSPGNANMPKDKFDVVEHLSDEKQQVPSAVSTIMNSQRAKLRSSQKSTVMESFDTEMEPQQKLIRPSLKKPSLELVEPAQVQEAGNTQQDQQPDELEEFKPKPKGRGRPPKKSRQLSKKVKVGNRRSKPKGDDDKVSGKSKSTNKKGRPKKKLPGKHKMPSKSSKKKKKQGR